MRQRLGIARCLIADPALLILDEPMNGLDPAGILEMRHLIRAFVDEGRTVFLSSHLLDEVEKTCDQIAIVDRGRIVVQGGVQRNRRDRRSDGVDRGRRRRGGAACARRPCQMRDRRARRCGSQLQPATSPRRRSTARSSRPGIAVSRLEPARATLEEKFLDDHVAAGGQRMRLVRAEVLKLVRRRGLMVWCLLLTIGVRRDRRDHPRHPPRGQLRASRACGRRVELPRRRRHRGRCSARCPPC